MRNYAVRNSPQDYSRRSSSGVSGWTTVRNFQALVAAALYVPDRVWVEQWLVHFAVHPDPDVRRAAALALGHLARLHKEVSPQAISAVRKLLEDRQLAGAATDALEDVEIFTRSH
ncbi:HEAT repeat domain-containing protein [Streptomyces sp. NBC_00344]|uniref:HEAT repeat domain-containing protein n=1 Tax=Streptomyces sp. NBC_00344 TaxID=2975720 RepID=UPI002E1D083C